MNRKTLIAIAASLLPFGAALANTEIVIATVNNRQMIEMQKLTPVFEKANPDIK